LEGADVATFQVVDKWGALAKDAKQVYYRTDVIEGADPVTFEVVGGVGRDKADYYIGPTPLRVRDRASFKVLDEKVLGKDDHIWAHDKLDYYVGKQPTQIADSGTFQVIQSLYAKDAKQVYFGSAVLAGADPVSFQGIGGESGEFAKDAKHVYCQGQVVEGGDAATFQLLQYRYAKDSRRAYYCYDNRIPPLALAGSDAKTFEVIGPSSHGFGYAKDAEQVYSGPNVIAGADPATFVVDPSDPEKASDKHRRYQYGEPVEEPKPATSAP
ncbi:MAG: DKNYY domain-containing protein, partial [Verrucomicrobiaceae bacterium]